MSLLVARVTLLTLVVSDEMNYKSQQNLTVNAMAGLVELVAGLDSLRFEHGMAAQHRGLIKLKSRRHNLIWLACADSAFLCRLLLRIRQEVQVIFSTSLGASHALPPRSLHVGIIGAGHLGKRLIHCLLDLTDLHPTRLCVSTRHPETLGEFRDRGVRCFYDNARLVREAELVFLCCLPSQLPGVCAEINSHLPEHCVLYSLVSGIPLRRLKNLLCHSSVIRPEYQSDPANGESDHPQHTIFRVGSLVRATVPQLPQDGGEHTVTRIILPAVYTLLNVCTSHGLSHSQSVSLLNSLLQLPTGGTRQPGPQFTSSDFVSQEFVLPPGAHSSFPHFDLTCVHEKETPLSQCLTRCPQLRSHLLHLYSTMLLHPENRDTYPNLRYVSSVPHIQ